MTDAVVADANPEGVANVVGGQGPSEPRSVLSLEERLAVSEAGQASLTVQLMEARRKINELESNVPAHGDWAEDATVTPQQIRPVGEQVARPTHQRLNAVEHGSVAMGQGLNRLDNREVQLTNQVAVLTHQVGRLEARWGVNNGKIPEPVKFSGEKGCVPVDTFIAHFDLYAQDLGLAEGKWPTRALYFLTGKALETVLSMLQSSPELKDDWSRFCTALRNAFGLVAPEFAVRAKLDKLKQTGSVASYYEAFRGLRARAGASPVDGAEAIHYFVKGLKENTRVAVAVDPMTREPYANLDLLVRHALAVDQAMFGARAENVAPAASGGDVSPKHKGKKNGHGKRPAASPAGSGAPAKSFKSRDGDGPRVPRCDGVCPMLAAHRMDRRECIKCGDTGHQLKDCKKSAPYIPDNWEGANNSWKHGAGKKSRSG